MNIVLGIGILILVILVVRGVLRSRSRRNLPVRYGGTVTGRMKGSGDTRIEEVPQDEEDTDG